ncbi:MAG: bifunctional folylpolyglutamate synthase/dihydrofolate synthase [Bacillota bacterium]|jgi:dihydrofolate synthase/folylpolyglutamate synthase
MNEIFTFEEAMDFLRDRTRFGINFGLQRIERLLEKMGNPHQKQVKYIHIGGTNGKGSTLAYLTKILQYAGYRTGTFISPHLHSYTERMQINGENIPETKVAELITKIKPLLDEMEAEGSEPPTEFEVNTAMALQYFTDENVDYGILEVGLGGSIDSTNVILPEISIITNVGMDHMDYIGNTIAEIATIKSGIIKTTKPIVTASRSQEALSILRTKAAECNSEISVIDEDFRWENRTTDGYKQTADFICHDYKLHFTTKMLGQHQLDNASLAIMAAKKLGIYNDELIARAVHDTFWAGRLEILSENPMVVIDGAHNADGMTCLASAIKEYWQDYQITAVIGMLADKEREKALAELLPLVNSAVITKVPNARAGNWEHLADICSEYGVPVETQEFIDDACEAGLAKQADIAAPKKMLLVTGSLYMIADARAYLLNRL